MPPFFFHIYDLFFNHFVLPLLNLKLYQHLNYSSEVHDNFPDIAQLI